MNMEKIWCVQAGVRSLSRHLAAMCRHVAVQIVSQQDQTHAQLHEEQPDSNDMVVNGHSQVYHTSLASTAQQQQQQQQRSGVGAPEDVPASCDPLHTRTRADLDASALESDLQSGTTASAGPFFWGGLWGGLKGAFTPPRQHHRRRFQASYQLPQAANHPDHSHARPADDRMSYAVNAAHEHAGALSGMQHPRQRHMTKVRPQARWASAPHSPGSQGRLTAVHTSTTSVGEGQQAGNPYGGINSDMVKPAHDEVQALKVTAQLIEEVLGPRKYNETDSADSLVAPGDLSFVSSNCGASIAVI